MSEISAIVKPILKYRLIRSFVLVFLAASIVVVLLSNTLLYSILPNQSRVVTQELIDQISYRTDAEVSKILIMIQGITRIPSVQYYLKDIKTNRGSVRVATYSIIREILKTEIRTTPTIENIYVYPIRGVPINAFYSVAIFENDEFIDALLKETDWIDHKWREFDDETGYVSVCFPIFSAEGELLGIVEAQLNTIFAASIIDNVNIGDGGYIYLVDSDMRVIYKSGGSDRAEPEWGWNEKNCFIIEQSLLGGEWQIVGVLPDAEIVKQIWFYNLLILTVFVFVFTVIIILLAMYTEKNLRPLQKLMDAMQTVQQGRLTIISETHSGDEFDIVIENFNVMIRRILELVQKTVKQNELYRDAKLAEMSAKLNPHFLYNSLDTIYWMSVKNEQHKTAEFVISLSDILRYSISNSDIFVTVGEDIGVLMKFLTIHAARYNETLHTEINVPDGLKGYKILKLLLQPLVENALKHTFSGRTSEKFIRVTCREESDELFFSVEDNGIGITPKRIEQVFDEKNALSRGIGLKLTHDRLRYTYGDAYGLIIEGMPDKGTIVSFKVKKYPPEVIIHTSGGDADNL